LPEIIWLHAHVFCELVDILIFDSLPSPICRSFTSGAQKTTGNYSHNSSTTCFLRIH